MGAKDFRNYFDKKYNKVEYHFGINDGDQYASYEYFSKFKDDPRIKFHPKTKEQQNKNLQEMGKFNNNLKRLKRYSLENYIYDPLNIFFSLKKLGKIENIKEINKFLNIDNNDLDKYVNDSMQDFFKRSDLKKEDKEDVLNRIINSVNNSLIDFVLDLMSNKNNKKDKWQKEDILKSLYTLKSNLGGMLTAPITDISSEINDDLKFFKSLKEFPKYPVSVKYQVVKADLIREESLELEYNPFILFFKGHAIEDIFKKKLIYEIAENDSTKFPDNASLAKETAVKTAGLSINMELMCEKEYGFLFTEDLNEMFFSIFKSVEEIKDLNGNSEPIVIEYRNIKQKIIGK